MGGFLEGQLEEMLFPMVGIFWQSSLTTGQHLLLTGVVGLSIVVVVVVCCTVIVEGVVE